MSETSRKRPYSLKEAKKMRERQRNVAAGRILKKAREVLRT